MGEEWSWLRGALCTVDRSFGPILDRCLHHISDTHVCHHIFSKMPFYHAQEATKCIKKLLESIIFQILRQFLLLCGDLTDYVNMLKRILILSSLSKELKLVVVISVLIVKKEGKREEIFKFIVYVLTCIICIAMEGKFRCS